MFWFIITIILLFISLLWLAFVPKSWTDRDGTVWRLKRAVIIPLIFAMIALALSSFAVVGTKNVGVATQFGAITGDTYGAGLNFKAPWVAVHDIDATIQVEEYKGSDCIYVKIADGGTACISLGYRWRINPDGADNVYSDYRNSEDDITEAVRKALVSTNIKAAINEVLGTYDPLDGADLTADMTAEEISNIKINVVPDYQKINAEIQANLEAKIKDLGDLIDIQSVTVSYVKLPDSTQKKINAFNQAVQDTKIALQQIATKKAQAQGNNELAASLADPNVLVAQCFNSIASGEFTPPAGFSCWPGGGSSVVLPATK